MSPDEQYLRRAIRLAMNGRGFVEPNPMVGCVIVKNGSVIGEGFHQKFGQAHAEPIALKNCRESPEGATAYVTLEPCCHSNKKTPPCVPRLISAKISRVVLGCLDPNPEVNGNGLKQLREAGIAVDLSPLEAECKQLIAPFIKSKRRARPYVTLKWAESADRKLAGPGGLRMQISNPSSSHQVQLLRSRSDSICVGINTVLRDDPSLIPRGVPTLRPLHRLVLDSNLAIPVNSRLVQTARQTPTTAFCRDTQMDLSKVEHLLSLGLAIRELSPLQSTDTLTRRQLSLHAMLQYVGGSHLLVEPGPTLANGFFAQNAADRLWVIRSSKTIGGATSPIAAEIPDSFVPVGERNLDGDVLCEYLNTKAEAFFAPIPSADFVLAPEAIATA